MRPPTLINIYQVRITELQESKDQMQHYTLSPDVVGKPGEESVQSFQTFRGSFRQSDVLPRSGSFASSSVLAEGQPSHRRQVTELSKQVAVLTEMIEGLTSSPRYFLATLVPHF